MRHGDADTPACTYPDHHCMGLSESGRLQARQAAQDLSGLPVDRLIASPLPRAVNTNTARYDQVFHATPQTEA